MELKSTCLADFEILENAFENRINRLMQTGTFNGVQELPQT